MQSTAAIPVQGIANQVQPGIAMVQGDVVVFVGFTARTGYRNALLNQPQQIRSMRGFSALYGRLQGVFVTKERKPIISGDGLLERALLQFFQHGGTHCYVVSAGLPENGADGLLRALDAVCKVSDADLLLCPDAANFPVSKSAEIARKMLQVGETLGKCLSLIDVPREVAGQSPEQHIGEWRREMVAASGAFGAAFYPWLEVPVAEQRWVDFLPEHQGVSEAWEAYEALCDETDGVLTFLQKALEPFAGHAVTDPEAIKRQLFALFEGVDQVQYACKCTPVLAVLAVFIGKNSLWQELRAEALDLADHDHDDLTLEVAPWQLLMQQATAMLKVLVGCLRQGKKEAQSMASASDPKLEEVVRMGTTHLSTVPPAAAVAGRHVHYARTVGVWNVPDQLFLNARCKVHYPLNNFEQEWLHTDVENGLSVNAIRCFSDTGATVCAARTLAGKDMQRRYVQVARITGVVRQSLYNAFRWLETVPDPAVHADTVKQQAETFLNTLWGRNAFKGATAAHAYQVSHNAEGAFPLHAHLTKMLVLRIQIAIVKPGDFTAFELRFKSQAEH